MALDEQERAWYKRIAALHHAHYSVTKKYSRLHYRFGVPSVVLAAASGTTIFATMESSASEEWRLVAGILALASAILAALVTFLGYKERSDAHHKAGGLYGTLRTDIEYYSRFGHESPAEDKKFWSDIISKLDRYDIDSPVISKDVYDKSRAAVESYLG